MNLTDPKSITKQSTPQSILLFGGSFDPIHLGHIKTAEQTARLLAVDTVYLLPCYISPHKSATHANAEQRLTMVELACKNSTLLELNTAEITKKSPSYTVDTLQAIKQAQPNSKLYFIMGLDSLNSFTLWHRWQTILQLCHIIVNVRPGYDSQTIINNLPSTISERISSEITVLQQRQYGNIFIHHCQQYPISSTDIRRKLKQGKNCQQWLSADIFDYIKKEKLYNYA